ncbi:T7SS effector LXG polymorphic toxin [Jeotgalibacillus sp. ET6]|uniref:T7SS effector LXG polymorphic toxin n=1 Tax=Jeotgalibacillus sp. ET6 TaxID=3037260 RepID=UPI0024185B0D|nr:T7SS effector LXG polymorphic toxin [Jeotgalibacillus sp. ET6]MDG5471386.1 T7SS effector LXG polymorphic toxin [Jeotgalibacillus sp. ET6]
MSQTVRYDAAALKETMEERVDQYETFREQLVVLKEKMVAVTDLGEAFEGNAADAIKSFFKAQSLIAEMWIGFVDQQIVFMSDAGAMAEDRQLGGSSFVDVPFIEEELETAHVRTTEMIQKQHKDLAGILDGIRDLVAIEAYSTADIEVSLEDAKTKRSDTIEKVEEYDHTLGTEYDLSLESQELVRNLLDSLVKSTTQNGTITPVAFNVHAFEKSEAYTSIEGTREKSLEYIDRKQEEQRVREAHRAEQDMGATGMLGDPAATNTVPQSFLSWNNGPLFNMMSTSHLDQLFNSAYQPAASSTPENEVEKQLIQLQAEKGIQQDPVTEEDMEALREYILNPSTHSSSDSSSPANAGDWNYPDPTLADMRKVLGNPNSDVGVEEGGHYFVGAMKFMFEDVAVLLDPESTPDEIALAYMFTFFKPLKAADKGLDLAGGGKKVEDGTKGTSKVEETSKNEKITTSVEEVKFKQSSLDKAFAKHKNDFGTYPDGSQSSVELFKNDIIKLINSGVQKKGKYRNIEGTHIYNIDTKQWAFINSDGTMNTAFKLSEKQVDYLVKTGVVK